ncbi:putative phosphodiesterase [Natronocella acetinitrilica]|uniref:Phosphodiesterase n=1 Tax=Natronocella acetinitrilica TaxID=414046 RepID=A0AAE3G3V0_9GAMM|nr:metallophosphoesterase [Natronocella acetinitrilica]MCP1674594.1 putative phosphodiesterase [Natronocella acetinitrilica]
MTAEILYCGDPHGVFEQINQAAIRRSPDAMVLLGDFELDRPLHEAVAAARSASEIWWIAGNHDSGSVTQFDALYASALAGHDLHGRVVDIAGVRHAGLGGHFQGRIWWGQKPAREARFATRAAFLERCGKGNIWRGGLPLGRRLAIFPEDIEALAGLRTDVLVCHEAPSSHRHGFGVIDELARTMGASLIVHGHQHEDYTARLPGGIEVLGVGLAGVACPRAGFIVPGRTSRTREPARP